MAILGQENEHVVHPKNWPYSESADSIIGNYQLTTSQPANAAAFYGQLVGTFGAFQTTGSKSADTYYTYADITGSHGAMGTILFPQVASTATGFHTIKLTTDGVVEEFRTLSSTLEVWYRRWIGFAKEFADYGHNSSRGGDSGYGLYSFHKQYAGMRRFVGSATVRSVADSISQGVPVHQFNESLKVEVKCSLAGAAGTYEAYGTVLFTSAPNL